MREHSLICANSFHFETHKKYDGNYSRHIKIMILEISFYAEMYYSTTQK